MRGKQAVAVFFRAVDDGRTENLVEPEFLGEIRQLIIATRTRTAHIEFLQRAFNAEVQIRAEHEGVVRHARLTIGNGAIEMGDTQGAAEPAPTGIYLYVPDADALYEQAVAAGATPLAPPTDQSYGDRMGSVMDAQGITWFIAQPG